MFWLACYSYIAAELIQMEAEGSTIAIVRHSIPSTFLNREVKIDCYFPGSLQNIDHISLLLINDGQDLVTMQFENILEELNGANSLEPLLCIGIHCGKDRKNEYGTAGNLDYKGRGARAELYSRFVLGELIPFIRSTFNITSFKEKAFAGFSLGGLSALDIVLNYPNEFSKVMVCSGSMWWRDKDHEDPEFNEETDRIMHRQVREGECYPWLRFFFEVGTMDETADRNNNGIIDSIDDTVSLIKELVDKGYPPSHIEYLELADGKHDVATWARVMPVLLVWGFGEKKIG